MKTKIDKNLMAKILSVVIAVLLWSYVMSIENPQETRIYRNVKVNYLNTDSIENRGLTVSNLQEVYVNIRVRGNKKDLDKLYVESIVANADLEGYSYGENRIPITARLKTNRDSTEIVSISPSDVLVNIDKIIQKDIPLKTVTYGNPKENFVVGEITSTVSKIKIEGPLNQVNKVQYMETNIDITDKDSSFTISNPIYPIDIDGEVISNIEYSPNTADVTVPIYKTQVLPIYLVTTGEGSDKFAITDLAISPQSVTIKYLDANIKNISKIETAPVDLSKLNNGNALPLELKLPDGVSLINPDQKIYLNYTVHQWSKKVFQINHRQLNFYNLPEGMSIDESSLLETYDVPIKGYRSVLENLDIGNYTFDVDLSDVNAGENKVQLNLHKKENETLDIDGVYYINLTIKNEQNNNEE